MKRFYALFIILLISHLSNAATSVRADTIKKTNGKNYYTSGGLEPEYPGGPGAFDKYISKHLYYPGAARLMCINGKVYVSFVIEKDGKVTNVTALNCIGAGCESEAVKVVQKSKCWKPGAQNGRPVSVNYVVPINFTMQEEKVYMETLAASDYGFVFNIKGKLYTIDEAEDILGKTFLPEKIEIAEPFDNNNKDLKFHLHHKKEVYLLIIKPT